MPAQSSLEQEAGVVGALSHPESYPHRPRDVEVRETHISWVFLAGERAYKLKKPLVLDFLDYGTPDRRRTMCEEELRLNRRLAPDVYLGVRGVACADGVAELTPADDPRAVDFVVEMRRYDERDTLAARLARGELSLDHVRETAGVLARFHAQADRAHGSWTPPLVAERRFERNLQELLGLVGQRSEIGRVLALERFAHAFVTSHARTFQMRAAAGLIRDGHGDLRAEHVIIDGGAQIVDCVEFDQELRELDVGDDLAFLVFDLTAQRGVRFATELVRAYRAAGGDPGEDALISFYAAYRALVRAKVALVRMAQLPAAGAQAGHESAHARDLIAVAERFAWRARLPLIVVVCGVPASGKSRLAAALSELSGLPHLGSDATRKRLAGLQPTERAPVGTYSGEWNLRTYRKLGSLAARALRTGGGMIVDATFRHLNDRRAFSSALPADARLLFVECRAPRAVLMARAQRRGREPERTSDADREVVMREQDRWEPLDEVPADAHIAVRTDRSSESITNDILAVLDQRLQDRPLA